VLEAGGGGPQPGACGEEKNSRCCGPPGLLRSSRSSTPTNVAEDELSGGNAFHRKPLRPLATKEGAAKQCASQRRWKAELIELGAEERADYSKGSGVSEGGLVAGFGAHLPPAGACATYFTTGEKENPRPGTITAA